MIAIVFPSGINWFYENQARFFARDLTVCGIAAETIASSQIADLARSEADTVLVVNFAEALFAAQAMGVNIQFVEQLRRFKRRILVNHDSLLSPWFRSQLSEGRGFFSDVFDVSMCRQTAESHVFGIRYHWVREAFTRDEISHLTSWEPGRPIPWAMVAHATKDRAALVGALIQRLPSDGFVFCPPLRPFTTASGLDRADLEKMLRKSDLYIWGSHHRFPYHEALRALNAVAAGAVPAKIDPLFSDRIDVPWVYPSVDDLTRRISEVGLDAMYRSARTFIEKHGLIGENIADALGVTISNPAHLSEPIS